MTTNCLYDMKQIIYKNRYWLITIGAALVFFGIWELVARLINVSAVLPTFTSVILALCDLLTSGNFYVSVGYTLLRAIVGYVIAFILGLVIGITAGKYKGLAAAMKPLNAFMRTVPVAAVTLVFAIWIGSNILPSVIGILLIFPVIYEQSRSATENIPRDLENVMDEAGASFAYRFRRVYLPMILPQVMSGISSTFGMNVKAVITAETLAYSLHSIGIQIYYAKTNFITESPTLFAWVIAAVILSVLLEVILKKAIKLLTDKFSSAVIS